MSNERFPKLPGLAPGSVWAPEFSTKIQRSVSQREYRASLAAHPIYNVRLKFNYLRHGAAADLRALVGFFLARRGSFDSFLYEHPDDNAVVDQLVAVANGVVTAFQLVRGYGSAFVEPVQNVREVASVKVNGVPKTLGADYTVTAGGLVLFNAAPLVGNITWTGTYDYRARFALDSQDYEKFMHDLWKAGKVDLLACLGSKI